MRVSAPMADSRKGVWDRAESRWTRATHQRFVQGSVNPRRESGSEQRTLQSIIPRGSHRADVEAKRPRGGAPSVFCRETARVGRSRQIRRFFFTREWRRLAFPFAAAGRGLLLLASFPLFHCYHNVFHRFHHASALGGSARSARSPSASASESAPTPPTAISSRRGAPAPRDGFVGALF